MLQDTPGTFLFGQTLGHERDGTEDLRMPGFVCIENRHEHNAEVILVKFHAIFLPEPPEGPQGVRSPREDFLTPRQHLIELFAGRNRPAPVPGT